MIQMYLFILLFIFVKTVDATICIDKSVPDQIRLALAGDHNVSVAWHSFSCPFSSKNPNPTPTVIYGLKPKELTFTSINGKSSSYDDRNIYHVSWFYSVELPNLRPYTIYYYKIVASQDVSESAVFSFRSAPSIGDRSRPINISMHGDLGVDGPLEVLVSGPNLFKRALAALGKVSPWIDLYLHHGDICYADDAPWAVPGKTYEEVMNECQTKMASITSTHFFMFGLGNHEINCTEIPKLYDFCPANYRNQIPFTHRFNMPGAQSGGYLNAWYSFNYGFVHIISLSCETDFPGAPSGNLLDDTTQINWLKKDLASVNRAITPWIIVQCHRPWKGSKAIEVEFVIGGYNCPTCQAAFEAILVQYKVDIYIAGHVHWYERICLNGSIHTTEYVNPDGPVYLTNGAIGNPEGNVHTEQQSTDSCYITSEPGFGILTVYDDVRATFTFHATLDLAVLDRINITKHR